MTHPPEISPERVLACLQSIKPEIEFQKSQNYFDDGLLDSFDLILLISILEKMFDVKIAGRNIVPEHFQNVQAIAELLRTERPS